MTPLHVFGILGAHQGHYYGEIAPVFRRIVMFHPDVDFSIQAATSFNSGNGYQWRPWLHDPGRKYDRVKAFHESKLRCIIPDYETAAALQLMAVAGMNKKTADVSLKKITKWWSKVNSHKVFEAHLPELTLLDFIDYVYMPQTVLNSLKVEALQSVKAIFGRSVTHNIRQNWKRIRIICATSINQTHRRQS